MYHTLRASLNLSINLLSKYLSDMPKGLFPRCFRIPSSWDSTLTTTVSKTEGKVNESHGYLLYPLQAPYPCFPVHGPALGKMKSTFLSVCLFCKIAEILYSRAKWQYWSEGNMLLRVTSVCRSEGTQAPHLLLNFLLWGSGGRGHTLFTNLTLHSLGTNLGKGEKRR